MKESDFVILRQLPKTSGDLHDGRPLEADLMPGALTQDPTNVAMTPERGSQQTESVWGRSGASIFMCRAARSCARRFAFSL
jgi:hypothetical protein